VSVSRQGGPQLHQRSPTRLLIVHALFPRFAFFRTHTHTLILIGPVKDPDWAVDKTKSGKGSESKTGKSSVNKRISMSDVIDLSQVLAYPYHPSNITVLAVPLMFSYEIKLFTLFA
jgi:hypothetical protein